MRTGFERYVCMDQRGGHIEKEGETAPTVFKQLGMMAPDIPAVITVAGEPVQQPRTCLLDNRKRVHVYLGEPKSLDITKTDVLNLMGQFVHRLKSDTLSENKPLENYPIVFNSPKALEMFEAMKQELNVSDNMAFPASSSSDVNERVSNRLIYALSHAKVFLAKDYPFQSSDKIYLIGHGRASGDELELDGDSYPIKDIPRTLKQMGVKLDTKDIRLVACHSADAKAPDDLRVVDLSRYADTYHRFFLGLSFLKVAYKAPAQTLVDAFHQEGFVQAMVAGYHGCGVYFKPGEYPQTTLRNPKLPTAEGFNHDNTVRRRDVRRYFLAAAQQAGFAGDRGANVAIQTMQNLQVFSELD